MLMTVTEIKNALDCCIENQKYYDIPHELLKCDLCPLQKDKFCYKTLLTNLRLFVNDYLICQEGEDGVGLDY